MKKFGFVLLIAACFALVFSVVATAAADPYPKGCSDCHKKTAAKDDSFPALLKKLPKHPPVSATADINACLKCHKAGTKMALNTRMHASHQKAKIACSACHIMKGGKPGADLKGVKK